MRKINLVKYPELFQGYKYLDKNKNYFEGWYFKNINKDNIGISFIVGININNIDKNAFIQVITNDNSYYFNYDIDDFKYSNNPFYIRIKDNYFSFDNIYIDITDSKQDIIINGDIGYYNSININTSRYSPNIMGPFSYIPFMECNHTIISMKNNINGYLNINNKFIDFNNGIGYIEKDYGCSFPKSYIWCQGNNFNNSDVSFMLSIADIPFKLFNFRGVICSLIIDNYEYRFATYNNTKFVKYNIDDKRINISLKKGLYYLDISCKYLDGFKLIAPIKGKMNREIIESINENIRVILRKEDKIIFSDISNNCGLEIAL